jgi:hypothetical protein
LPECKFTSQYNDYQNREAFSFYCQEEPLASGFCIFHDKEYLQDKTNYEEHKTKVLDRLTDKVNHAISNNEPLLCIGFQLPDFSLSDLSIISKEFTIPVYFNDSQFLGKADLYGAKFHGETNFFRTKFQGETFFSGSFGETNFNYVLFEGKEKVIFDIENLSNVSFMNTDLTGVRFSDKARWRMGRRRKES